MVKQVSERSLMDSKTLDQVCALRRDHFDCGDFWIISDGYTVSLANQKSGEPAKQMISIPKQTFDALVRRYMKPQKLTT